MKSYRPEKNDTKRGLYKQLLAASQLGLHMVLATFAGLAIGYFLDKYFTTEPLLTITFLLIGIIAGFVELFRLAKKQAKSDGEKDL